jgi:hypothetical protein
MWAPVENAMPSRHSGLKKMYWSVHFIFGWPVAPVAGQAVTS